MEPKEWWQVNYSRDGVRWYTVSDEKGMPKRYYSQAAAEQEEVNQKNRRFYPAKHTMSYKITETYFSSLEDRRVYTTWHYSMLV